MRVVVDTNVLVSPSPLKTKLPDPSDLPFLEVAASEGVPIITGNKKHFESAAGIKIFTPAEFLEWWEKGGI